jgi:hypothetical protein
MKKQLILLSFVSSILLADTFTNPLPASVKATDNGGVKSAIDAYKDGIGAELVEKPGVAVDNSAMNILTIKYGEAAKINNVTVVDQVVYGNSNPTAADLALAGTLTVNGAACNDSNINTTGETWLNGLCQGGVVTIKESCNDILNAGFSTGSGTYTIDPDGNGGNIPFNVYCDMVTDGGGWTLAIKVTGSALGTALNGRDSASWSSGLIGSTADTTASAAIGPAYSSVSFNSVMIRSLSNSNKRLSWQHPVTYSNLKGVVLAKQQIKNGILIGGSIQELDYKTGCGTGNTPPSIYYGFYVADNGLYTNNLIGAGITGWGGAIIGYGSNNYTNGYNMTGGVGMAGYSLFTNNKWDINRHIHGYGNGCTLADWNTGNTNGTQSFLAHGVFVK